MAKGTEIWVCPQCGCRIDIAPLGLYAEVQCPRCFRTERVHTQLGNFRLDAVLGVGGMSVVYRAFDVVLHRPLALKVLNDTFRDQPERIERFENESAMMARVRDENVTSVYSAGRAYRQFYIAMELIEGVNLEYMVSADKPMGATQALDIIRQVASGLRAASEAGLLHRDMKPGNVLITPEGRAKVIDFGLAMDSREGDTEEIIWATPYYVPPETLQRAPEDVRTDIYALGMTLRFLLTGIESFQGDTSTLQALIQHKSKLVPLARSRAKNVPLSLAELVDHMTQFSPADRPKDYNELLEEIAEVQAELATARKELSPEAKRRILIAKAALLLACAGIGAGLGAIVSPSSPPQQRSYITIEAEMDSSSGRISSVLSAALNLVSKQDYTSAVRTLAIASRDEDDPTFGAWYAQLARLISAARDSAADSAATAHEQFTRHLNRRDAVRPETSHSFAMLASIDSRAYPAPADWLQGSGPWASLTKAEVERAATELDKKSLHPVVRLIESYVLVEKALWLRESGLADSFRRRLTSAAAAVRGSEYAPLADLLGSPSIHVRRGGAAPAEPAQQASRPAPPTGAQSVTLGGVGDRAVVTYITLAARLLPKGKLRSLTLSIPKADLRPEAEAEHEICAVLSLETGQRTYKWLATSTDSHLQKRDTDLTWHFDHVPIDSSATLRINFIRAKDATRSAKDAEGTSVVYAKLIVAQDSSQGECYGNGAWHNLLPEVTLTYDPPAAVESKPASPTAVESKPATPAELASLTPAQNKVLQEARAALSEASMRVARITAKLGTMGRSGRASDLVRGGSPASRPAVWASSAQQDHPASDAIDGKLDTRWCADVPKNGETFVLDIDTSDPLSAILLHWENSNKLAIRARVYSRGSAYEYEFTKDKQVTRLNLGGKVVDRLELTFVDLAHYYGNWPGVAEVQLVGANGRLITPDARTGRNDFADELLALDLLTSHNFEAAFAQMDFVIARQGPAAPFSIIAADWKERWLDTTSSAAAAGLPTLPPRVAPPASSDTPLVSILKRMSPDLRETWIAEKFSLIYMPDGSNPKDQRSWTRKGSLFIGSDGQAYDFWDRYGKGNDVNNLWGASAAELRKAYKPSLAAVAKAFPELIGQMALHAAYRHLSAMPDTVRECLLAELAGLLSMPGNSRSAYTGEPGELNGWDAPIPLRAYFDQAKFRDSKGAEHAIIECKGASMRREKVYIAAHLMGVEKVLALYPNVVAALRKNNPEAAKFPVSSPRPFLKIYD